MCTKLFRDREWARQGKQSRQVQYTHSLRRLIVERYGSTRLEERCKEWLDQNRVVSPLTVGLTI